VAVDRASRPLTSAARMFMRASRLNIADEVWAGLVEQFRRLPRSAPRGRPCITPPVSAKGKRLGLVVGEKIMVR